MNFRKNLILLLVLIVAVLLVIALERPFKKDTDEGKEKTGLLFPALKTEGVKKLEISQPKEKKRILLQHIDGIWYVANADAPAKPGTVNAGGKANALKDAPQPGKETLSPQSQPAESAMYPADQQAVTDALEKLKGVKEGTVASRNKEKHTLFDVADESAMTVTASGADGKEYARLLVGKEGPDFFSTYIRTSGSDIVYLHPDFIKGSFDRELENWRNRRILDFAPANVAGLAITRNKETVSLKKGDSGEWRIEQPVRKDADTAKVTSLVSSLSTLTAGKFADTVKLRQAGLAPPATEVAVTFNDGTVRSLLIGAASGQNYYYVKTSDQNYVYEAYKNVVDTLTPSLKELAKAVPAPAAGSDANAQPSAVPSAPVPAPDKR